MLDPAPASQTDVTDMLTPDFVVIDVETACSRVSSICQVGIVGFRDGREIFEYETLVDPRDEFNVFNTRIHGITEDHVTGKPCFADIHGIVDGHLSGRTTVAHSYFDKGALAAACRIHDRPPIQTVWLDSVRVAQRAWPDLANHRLGGLAQYLGIAHKHHDALSDARAAGWVIVKAIDHTGIALDEWLKPPRKPGPAPRPLPPVRSAANASPFSVNLAMGGLPTRLPRLAGGSCRRSAIRRLCSSSPGARRSAIRCATAARIAARSSIGGSAERSVWYPRSSSICRLSRPALRQPEQARATGNLKEQRPSALANARWGATIVPKR
ncbi:exonuclease domain-containing protein [Sphingomonas sp. 22L2VL55-3]